MGDAGVPAFAEHDRFELALDGVVGGSRVREKGGRQLDASGDGHKKIHEEKRERGATDLQDAASAAPADLVRVIENRPAFFHERWRRLSAGGWRRGRNTPSSGITTNYYIVRCGTRMKRILSKAIYPLLAGVCLRIVLVLKFPAGSSDTVIYEQLATNWLKHGKYAMDIAGQPVPVDLRMPGYPAFLALISALTGRTGVSARPAVMFAQVLMDLACCVAIAALGALLVALCSRQAHLRRAFLAGLWLAALCPFTANYVAVPLTEVWATFLTAMALLILMMVAAEVRGEWPEWPRHEWIEGKGYWSLVALGGFIVGVGALFRPETPLLLVTSLILLGLWMWWRGETK